ncbi:unnamed protein product [Citrullus colocynthis]|uniref:Thaumatin-like protein n=1 Tax=Citrullus colocynthis TaxID=252529 RepID=A0ABP0YGW3_9ROSI
MHGGRPREAAIDDDSRSRVLRHRHILRIEGARVLESTRTFTIVNSCKDTIWPAITPGGNISGGGFSLKGGQSVVYTIPDSWTGRIWARTGCDFDKDGNGKCRTGGCGEVLNCTGPGSRPSTLADFTLGSIDYYDVSVVDGFNLPIAIQPSGGKGNCSSAGCDGDLRDNCPPELAVKDDRGKVVACRSACDVFHTGEYCCTGQFDNPMTCLPTNYSRSFKQVCPAAYSFGYDDPTSILTCSSADYVVAFCATRNQKVCSYHDKQLKCNVESSKAATLVTISQRWQNFIFTFLFILKFGILF